jgi:hypothetical protein
VEAETVRDVTPEKLRVDVNVVVVEVVVTVVVEKNVTVVMAVAARQGRSGCSVSSW